MSKLFIKINKSIRDPKYGLYYFLYKLNRLFFNFLPDILFLKAQYYVTLGKELNIKNPKSFNEKLQWLKLYDKNIEYSTLVDKYAVKEYVASTIGSEYVVPLLGVWDKYEDINFDNLPNQFVLKTAQWGVWICKDRATFDFIDARKKINKCLKKNFYYFGKEYPYKYVKPKIICEKYFVDETGFELKDYKVFCFSGVPKVIQVDFNRFIDHRRNLYDTEWNYINASIQYPNDPAIKIVKPKKLNIMLELASILAKNYPHVRVDFYLVRDKIYFGELTFYHGNGLEVFSPISYDYLFGSWITLPK